MKVNDNAIEKPIEIIYFANKTYTSERLPQIVFSDRIKKTYWTDGGNETNIFKRCKSVTVGLILTYPGDQYYNIAHWTLFSNINSITDLTTAELVVFVNGEMSMHSLLC